MLREQYHHSVYRCVIHDGWHFYLVDYGASVQQLLFRPDVEPRNRKNRIQSTIPGCLTRKHCNFGLSITNTALAPLTCLWPTEDKKMVFLTCGTMIKTHMVLILVFKTKVEDYRKASGGCKAYICMTSLDCMIRESKSINKVYKSRIYMEPYSVVCTRSSLF